MNGDGQVIGGSGCGGPEEGFHFSEGLLDGVEVWTVGRKVKHPCAHRLDGLAHPGDLVSVEIVEDDGVAGLEHRGQSVGDVGSEPHTVRRSVEDGLGDQSRGPQGGSDCVGLVVMGWTPPDGIDVPEWWCCEPPEGGVRDRG